MVGSKRPASLRPDTSLAKRPRYSKVAPRRKTQSAEKTGHLTGSDSDNSISVVEENNDVQSPANDQGRPIGPPGNDIPSTMIRRLTCPLVASDKKSSCSSAANYPSTSCSETTFRSFGQCKKCLVSCTAEGNIQGRAHLTYKFFDGNCPREDSRYRF